MKKIARLLLPLLVLGSCTEKTPLGPEFPDLDASQVGHGMIELGERLEDPYSLENMAKALESVYPTRASRYEISPTDMYVRFLPTDDSQFELLEEMGLRLIDHPLDYRIVRDGDYYHDPSVPEDEITWQYAVVPPGFTAPKGIRYEVIDECYIPSNDPATRADGLDWDAVEREAFRATGNEDLLEPETRAGDGKAYPQGRITIEDEKLGESVGVAGVMVSCNVFVKFAHAYTDSEGRYKISVPFSEKVRYRLVFSNRQGFDIGFNMLLVPASVSALGTNPATGVNLEINSKSDRKLFCRAAVNNACYDYYSSCKTDDGDMSLPPSGLRIWLFQSLASSSTVMLQHGAVIDNDLVKKYLGEYAGIIKTFLPDVTLGMKGRETYSEIYAEACHEMAHASHFAVAGSGFWDKFIYYILKSYVTNGGLVYGLGDGKYSGHCEVGEMWAYYVENAMFRDRYGADAPTWGLSFWFSPHTLLYLDERGLGRYDIFAALGADVDSSESLRDRLMELYPGFESIVEQAFARYR